MERLLRCLYKCLNRCGGEPRHRKANSSHYWWNAECEEAKRALRKAERKAPPRQSWTPDQHQKIIKIRQSYKKAIWFAKRQSVRDLISEVDSTHDMSKVAKIIRRTKTQEIGLLRKADGNKCKNTEEVLNLLLTEHFPKCASSSSDNTIPSEERIYVPQLPWINLERVKAGIDLFGLHKAAGQEDIKPIVMQN